MATKKTVTAAPTVASTPAPVVVEAPKADHLITFAETVYDTRDAVQRYRLISKIAETDAEILPDAVRESVKLLTVGGMGESMIADAFKAAFADALTKWKKAQEKPDWRKVWLAETVKIGGEGGREISVKEAESKVAQYIALLDAARDLFNKRNESANLRKYEWSGGSPGSRQGGKGEGRDYGRLNSALALDLTAQTLVFPARNAVYLIVRDGAAVKLKYQGASFTRGFDKAKGEWVDLELKTGQLFDLRDVNRLNKLVNSTVVNDSGAVDPDLCATGVNSWVSTRVNAADGKTLDEYYDALTVATVETETAK